MSLSPDAASPERGLDAQIRRALRGDAKAYASVVLATQRGITGLALAIVRDIAISEDIAQEAYLRGWRDRERLRDAEAFLPWLRQVVRNLARDHLRGQRRQRHAGTEERDAALASLADPQPDAEQSLSRNQEWSAVFAALDALPEDARETLLIYYREGEDSAIAGRLLGVSPEAVRQRVSRARRSLRARVLVALDDGLRASAPGSGFTAAVLAAIGGGAIGAAAPSAALASIGAAGGLGLGKYGTGQGMLVGLGQTVAAACAAVALGVCGALLGIRLRGRDAVRRDDPGIRIAVEVYAVAAALAFMTGIAAGARLERIEWWYLPLVFLASLAIGAAMARVVPPMIRRLNRVGRVQRLNARFPPMTPTRLRLVALGGAIAGAVVYLLLIGLLGR